MTMKQTLCAEIFDKGDRKGHASAAVGQAISGAPNKEVMECFGVPQRTASRWIAQAREAGLLD